MGNYTNTINWLLGRARDFFGPEPGTLVPLNILAAFFAHEHSDASMRILHGYTSIGLIIGIFSTFSILVNIRSKLKKIRVFVPLLIINIWAFYTNTWVAINGMGIPYGKQFHIFLAVLIIFNYSIFRKYTNLKETSDLIIK
tara:strand:- start:112 stop:534 length:423 start_codon:yes stop_codon:yes gene_type:complete